MPSAYGYRATPPESHKGKAPINVVMYPLTPTGTDSDAAARTSADPAETGAADITMTTRSGLGTGSGPEKATATAHTGGSLENGAVVKKNGTVGSRQWAAGLTGEDVRNLNAVLRHAIADNTRATYRGLWRRFTEWAVEQRGQRAARGLGRTSPPTSRNDSRGKATSPRRYGQPAAAIACIHRAAGLDDPCAAEEVRRALSGATRKAGKKQKQAAGLTAEALALHPGHRTGSRAPAGAAGPKARPPPRAGASRDVALISLMRDAMLRVSEAAALTWADIVAEHRRHRAACCIHRSKTDPEGDGAVVYVAAPTMARLASIRDGAAAGDSVFGLRHHQLAKRIKQAARAAGLGDGFSGHSPRVGMARDLARAGIELPRLMNAGRWRSPAMPALYTRNETAAKGAVAQFYGSTPGAGGRGAGPRQLGEEEEPAIRTSPG